MRLTLTETLTKLRITEQPEQFRSKRRVSEPPVTCDCFIGAVQVRRKQSKSTNSVSVIQHQEDGTKVLIGYWTGERGEAITKFRVLCDELKRGVR